MLAIRGNCTSSTRPATSGAYIRDADGPCVPSRTTWQAAIKARAQDDTPGRGRHASLPRSMVPGLVSKGKSQCITCKERSINRLGLLEGTPGDSLVDLPGSLRPGRRSKLMAKERFTQQGEVVKDSSIGALLP